MSGTECLHGLLNRYADANGKLIVDGVATVFPQSIGLAATWNRTLLRRVGEIISTEAVAKRNQHRNTSGTGLPTYQTCWGPVINIARDSRWGRVPETYGEDPRLTALLAEQYIKGIQGYDPQYIKVSAAPKHYTAYDGPETVQAGSGPAGRFSMDASVPAEDLADTYLSHWEHVVQNSGIWPLGGLMCSYSAVNGVPMCANDALLTDTLRTEWGFRGWVVSDCGAITNIETQHHYANSTEQAAVMAMTAGCDLECDNVYRLLPDAVRRGVVGEELVDRSVYRVALQQMQLGVYDPVGLNPYDGIGPDQVDSLLHRQTALEAAAQSIVLLSNDFRLLPLDLRKLHRIAVLGPSANDTQGYNDCWDANSGGCLYSHIYRGYSSFIITPLMGVQRVVGEHNAFDRSDSTREVEVVYAAGCDRSSGDTSRIGAAAELAASADVALIVVGLDPSFEEEDTDRMGGSNQLYRLPGVQQALIDAVVSTGTPVVVILMNGGPLSLVAPPKGALLEAFYGGQAGGDSLAEIAFGLRAPSGKMPVTTYANDEQAGNITDYDMTHGLGRSYRFLDAEPLYPFGHGLSYTNWSWTSFSSNVTAVSSAYSTVLLSLDLRNTGTVASEQVVQLYASLSPDFVSRADVSPHFPHRQLVDFSKVGPVPPGALIHMEFPVTPARLAGWGLLAGLEANTQLYFAVGGVSPTKATLAAGGLVTTRVSVQH
jgi:beta-glucosidase